jgi:hypothetical protein
VNYTRAIRPLRFDSAVTARACAPVISLAGAKFPTWISCLAAGILFSASLRLLFITAGIDECMTVRPLIYSCLALVVAFLSVLIVWR